MDDSEWALRRIEALMNECREIAEKFHIPFEISTGNGGAEAKAGSAADDGWSASSMDC